MTWKLPEHLEPYREYIHHGRHDKDTIETIMNRKPRAIDVARHFCKDRIDLLQRLYDAGKLK